MGQGREGREDNEEEAEEVKGEGKGNEGQDKKETLPGREGEGKNEGQDQGDGDKTCALRHDNPGPHIVFLHGETKDLAQKEGHKMGDLRGL